MSVLELECRLINLDSRAEMQALQRVLEGCPDYMLRVTGREAGPAEAQGTVTALPPNMTSADKFMLGFWSGTEMIGCADLIRGYPDVGTAHLGLMVLAETHQCRGLGRVAYSRVERLARSWGIAKMRLAVVSTNDRVLPFWCKQGFVETGVRKPYCFDKVVGESIIMEKSLEKPLETAVNVSMDHASMRSSESSEDWEQ